MRIEEKHQAQNRELRVRVMVMGISSKNLIEKMDGEVIYEDVVRGSMRRKLKNDCQLFWDIKIAEIVGQEKCRVDEKGEII